MVSPGEHRFHLAELRSAEYCGRQAFYRMKHSEEKEFEVNPETALLRQLPHIYPAVLDDPEEGLRRAAEHAEVDLQEIELGAEDVAKSVERIRNTLGEDGWDRVSRPFRHETYVKTRRLEGTVEKTVETEDGYAPSVIKTGGPPENGVWSSERVEATACARLVAEEFGSVDGSEVETAYVEYPRAGEVRVVSIDDEDERRVDSLLETLDEAVKGHPPSRVNNRSKCEACEFQETCGVKTESLLTRIKSRLPSK
ncbi:MAG: Dna2/Cas4 domain-containing protein [Halobacteria archaeon]|nr:Dna2/Cas4 domain-containing protein [Halobacteria archaeon]